MLKNTLPQEETKKCGASLSIENPLSLIEITEGIILLMLIRVENVALFSNAKMTTQSSKNIKTQGNIIPPTEHNNFLLTNSRVKENCNFPRKYLK